MGRPRPDMHTRVISTRSKVKVKVTELLNVPKVALFYVYLLRHFGGKLKTYHDDNDSMGRSLELVGARFLNFILRKIST